MKIDKNKNNDLNNRVGNDRLRSDWVKNDRVRSDGVRNDQVRKGLNVLNFLLITLF